MQLKSLEHIELVVIGVNHWDTPLPIREKFSLSEDMINKIYKESSQHNIRDFFILSTCNRTEIYAFKEIHERVKYCFAVHREGDPERFQQYIFEKKGKDALEHLMNVALGIDSQVLGDMQIFHQLKLTYKKALDFNLISGSFQRLMQHVFRAHKKSRSNTNIGEGSATVSHAAVKSAIDHFGDLKEINALLIGTGEIGQIAAKNLLANNCKKITLANRTFKKAMDFANPFGIDVVDFNHRHLLLNDFNLVIVATSHNKILLDSTLVNHKFAESGEKLIIDLSVPHNVDLSFDTFNNVKLINMDNLSVIVDDAYNKRKDSISSVKDIIDFEIENYKSWIKEQEFAPTIKALNEKLDSIRNEELNFYKNKIKDTDLALIENLTRRIVNKIASHHIEHLKNNIDTDESAVNTVNDIYKLCPFNESIKKDTNRDPR